MLALPPAQFCAVVDFGILNFDQYNVSFGSPAGDTILQSVAQTLQSHCHMPQPCARLSGDRFACLVTSCLNQKELLDRVSILNERLHMPKGTHHLQITYGLYIIDDRTLPAEDMCDRAVAARLGITPGENNIGVYDNGVHQKQMEDARLVESMEQSLQHREFVPYYQPKYDANTERIVGAEALVRWIRPDGTMIPPDRFIQLFEQNGLIIKLDMFMFETVCRKLTGMKDPVTISTNFSRAHMYDDDFPDKLFKIAQQYGVATNLLEIEITETAFMEQRDILIHNIFRLREFGFPVSVDDFGSGYSSLNLLKDIRFDVIKLDKEFLAHTDETQRGGIVIDSILSLAHALGVHAVAEGVETKEQLNFLREKGCDMIQGYYFSRPVIEKEFDDLLCMNNTSEEYTQSVKDDLI